MAKLTKKETIALLRGQHVLTNGVYKDVYFYYGEVMFSNSTSNNTVKKCRKYIEEKIKDFEEAEKSRAAFKCCCEGLS